jgi:hypothetical protein
MMFEHNKCLRDMACSYKSKAKDAPHANVFIHSPLALLCDGCRL